MIKILPSILTSDFTDVNKDIDVFKSLNIDEIHLDVMDGNFVPSMTFGPKYISDIKSHHSDLKLDTHLMINNPIKHIKDYIDAGSNYISIHIETSKEKEIKTMCDMCKEKNIKFGLAINPETNIKKLLKVLNKVSVDFVLIMSVHPGKGGQKFMPDTLSKADFLNEFKNENNQNFDIEIDGGINLDNIKEVIDKKIERIVIGSAIYKDGYIDSNVNAFNDRIRLIAGK